MTTIKLKNGSGAPTAGDLAQGEPALDLTNKRLYTEDSGGTVIEVGTNPGVDVTFADNRKAIFGAGSDLQIYHDGNHSYVSDQGTGSLRIQATDLGLETAAGNQNYLTGVTGGAVTLFHNGSTKLATTSTGIDVTGTVTADGLRVDGTPVRFVSTAPMINLMESGVADSNHRLRQNAGNFVIQKLSDDESTATDRLLIDGGTGDISFYEDTGTTAKLFWDASAESLGLGDTGVFNGTQSLNLDGEGLALKNNRNGSNNNWSIIRNTATASESNISFVSGAGEAMVIDHGGNVGIGTSSPADSLEVAGDVASAHRIRINNANASGSETLSFTQGSTFKSWIEFDNSTSNFDVWQYTNNALRFGTNNTERMRIDSSGNVGIGASSPVTLKSSTTLQVDGNAKLGDDNGRGLLSLGDIASTGANAGIWRGAAGAYAGTGNFLNLGGYDGITFTTGNADISSQTERMRIDSSGNLLVGTTSASSTKFVVNTNSRAGYFATSGATNTQDIINIAGTGGATSYNGIRFWHGALDSGSVVGSISFTSSATTYNTSSDQRLKDNIVDAPSASDDIDAIQVRSFDWKADGSHQKYGMVAQELQSVAPEAVSQGETEEDMMGVDYSKLVPMMLKEIQSLRARVAELENN